LALVKQYDRNTEAKRRAEKVLYSDFFKNFNVHPEKHDLARHVNEYAVNEALKNLFLTGKGERFFNPTFGTDVRRLLFEPMSPIIMDQLNTMIRDAIISFEPRVSVESVQVDAGAQTTVFPADERTALFSSTSEDNTVSVTIIYTLGTLQKRIVFSTVIERIR